MLPESSGKQSPCLSACANNYKISKHNCSTSQPNEDIIQHNSCTKPQQLPSSNSSDNLSGSKTSVVHPTDEKDQTNSTVELTSKQYNHTDIRSTAQPIISENTEIQASILALESLLQVNPNLKNKDVATKSFNKTQISERIANRNSKWEVDEKLGARATLGPVLYSNICLNLKETHPGKVMITVGTYVTKNLICLLY